MVDINSDKVLHYDPILRLSGIADKFISQDHRHMNMKSSLQECIDTLANYQDECKKLKKLSIGNNKILNSNDNKILSDIYLLYESAYIYYKIIHIIILNRIPNLPEFHNAKSQSATKEEKELMNIYNMLVKTLLNDDKVQHIKAYLRNNQATKNYQTVEDYKNDINKEIINSELFNLPLSGSNITAVQLNHLIQLYNDNLLVVDVRSRTEFDTSHVNCKNIICIEPVSFNESFTDLEIEKKSLITSPREELKIFQKRDSFNYVVIYTTVDDKKKFYLHQQLVLLDLLMNKSFTKPLFDKNIKIYTLEKGFTNWIKKKGDCVSTVLTDNKKDNLDNHSRYDNHVYSNNKIQNGSNGFHSVHVPGSKVKKQSGDSVYIDGNTSALSLQKLPDLTMNRAYTTDNSMKAMMNSSTVLETPKGYQLPTQQSPILQRTPSLKNLFNRGMSSSTVSVSSNSASPPNLIKSSQLNLYHPNLSSSFNSLPPSQFSGSQTMTNDISVAQYPETPRLTTSSMNHSNTITNTMGPISPIHTKAMTPPSKSIDSPTASHRLSRISSSELNKLKSIENYKPSVSTTMKAQSLKNTMLKPPSQSLPSLPQLPTPTNAIKSYEHSNIDYDFSVGIENMGNSCYMNCIVQCLLSSHEFTRIFLNNSYEKHINMNSKLGSKGVLARNFTRLLNTMYREGSESKKGRKGKAIRPSQFKLTCGSLNSIFKNNQQQDSQEFCQFLLDALHEDLNQCGANPPLKELSPNAEKIREKLSLRIASSIEWERYLTTDFSVIVDQFQGQYASQLKCKVCEGTSTTYQAFSVLSVPVPRGKSCNILDCFNEFTKVENLDSDELWSCPTCGKKQPSTKKLTITRLPRNLIIHLKRFDNMLNKNNIFVKYPYLLDLTPYWANDFDGRLPPGVTEELPTRGQVPPFKYKLNAVASHFGSLYGGHYTAYVDKGKWGWQYFDDTQFRPLKNAQECITPNAYVLFYHRVYGV